MKKDREKKIIQVAIELHKIRDTVADLVGQIEELSQELIEESFDIIKEEALEEKAPHPFNAFGTHDGNSVEEIIKKYSSKEW